MKIIVYKQVWDIWNNSKERLYQYVLSQFRNVELAEEVTQEVLFKIHKSCCSQKEISNLNSWLYQIAHNTSLDVLKKETRKIDLSKIDENQERFPDGKNFRSF